MARIETPVALCDEVSLDEERIHVEAQRIYATSAWVGPVGTTALTIILGSILWDAIPHIRLGAWMAVVSIGVIAQVASATAPSLRRQTHSNGLPRLTHFAHLLLGVSYGALLWLDPSVVEIAEYRWACLMAMFAFSAGVSTGLAGLHSIGIITVGPVWTMGCAALLVDGQWLIGMGGLLFLGVVVIDQRRSGDLWRELVELRVDHERIAEEQRWLAEHDTLTGLFNRPGALGLLESMNGPLSVMFVDLDGFKVINDEHGHAAGDQVLTEVGRRLLSLVGDGVVARLGGDEFIVLLEGASEATALSRLAQSAVAAIEQPIDTADGVVNVSASIGIDSTKDGVDDPSTVMAFADHAMLQAKRAGRNRVAVYDHAVTSGVRHQR